MKNKIKIEYLLYLFVIITPFLDVIACVFRNWFPNASLSPATIMRPIIPLVLLIYIFIKDKKWRKFLIVSAIILVSYGIGHLLIYKSLLTGISYGSVMAEAQYILNYTYMLYVLFIYLYFIKKKDLPRLKDALFIMLVCYLGLIYISIITGSSYHTYMEGMGYRGWFVSGNSLSMILIMLTCSLVDDVVKSKKIIRYVVFSLLGGYLLFLLGTRTGMFGFILVLGFYIFESFIFKFLSNKKIDKKKVALVGIVFLVLGGLMLVGGSETLKRRKHLSNEDTSIIDVNTGLVGHTTIDTSEVVYKIKNNELDDDYLSENQKNAYLRMYNIANKKEIGATDRRKQELLYHMCLVREQKNVLYVLFGNGYLANHPEMTLEIELFAMLFNFGILGLILYIGPFILIFIYTIRKYILDKKKIDEEKVMYAFGFSLAILLSCFMGAIFFSVSCVLIIICILSLFFKEGEVS